MNGHHCGLVLEAALLQIVIYNAVIRHYIGFTDYDL